MELGMGSSTETITNFSENLTHDPSKPLDRNDTDHSKVKEVYTRRMLAEDERDSHYKSAGQNAGEAGLALKSGDVPLSKGLGARAAWEAKEGVLKNKEAHQKPVEDTGDATKLPKD